jgi:hypothetical protein
MNHKTTYSQVKISALVLFAAIYLLSQFMAVSAAKADESQPLSTGVDPNPPASVVKLIFIHHSTGQNWLDESNGGLGLALSQNNYFVSDTNYGWGPDTIGDRTDIPNWLEWFQSMETATYMAALYAENGINSPYTRSTLEDPGGENEIILFKSCFPNSALEGNPNDSPSPDGWLTVGHAKYVYNQLLLYFQDHPDKLFVVVTAPPLIDGTYAANARAFNQWLMSDWLSQNHYILQNVAIFDFYNVLTGPNNHHRYYNGDIQHIFTPGMNTEYYPTGDDHPSKTGNLKATSEFIPLLNIFYHRWKNGMTPPSATTGSATNVTVNSAIVNGVVNPNGSLTTYYFEWGPTTAYGNMTPSTPVSVGSGTNNVAVSVNLSSLNHGNLYHYRLVAINVAGTVYGSDRIIKKSHALPFLMLLFD